MLASSPASTVNQKRPDLGIPNRFDFTSSRSNTTTNPGNGGYCQGFIISRLGTTPASITSGTNTTNGRNKVNWSNSQVSSCASPETSCIQLRLDAVGYAVSALLTKANDTENQTGITNQFRVGLYPFIQNLCYASVSNSSSCSVGLTTSLTGTTINNFATTLANLLDTGQNSTLGSGGTHFENALNLSFQRHRWIPGLSNAVERRLEFAKLELDERCPASEFSNRHSAEQCHKH